MNARNIFYFNFAVGLFLLGFLGFGINGLVNPEKLPPKILLIYIHAFFMFTWLLFLPIQIYRSEVKKLKSFRGEQAIVLGIVLGMLVTIFLMTAYRFQRENDLFLDATFNLFTLFNFALLIGLRFYHLKSVSNKNRLLLLASLSIILPALKRLLRIFLLEENFAFLLLLLLFVLFAVKELQSDKKIHKYTYLYAYLTFQSVGCSLLLSKWDSWQNILQLVMNWIPIH